MSFDNYFFTAPTFMRGFARAIDIAGVLSRRAIVESETPEEADASAIRSDWVAVGVDLRVAMDAAGVNGTRP